MIRLMEYYFFDLCQCSLLGCIVLLCQSVHYPALQ